MEIISSLWLGARSLRHRLGLPFLDTLFLTPKAFLAK